MALTVTQLDGRPGSQVIGRPSAARFQINGGGSGGESIALPGQYFGHLCRFTYAPDGSDVPAGNVTLAVKDDDGIDLLSGQGATLANNANASKGVLFTATDGTTPSPMPPLVAGGLSITHSGLGANKKYIITLYFK